MFRIFKIGFGEYLIMPYDPMDGLYFGIFEIVAFLMMIGLVMFIKDVIVIPILCIIAALAIASAFMTSNSLRPLCVVAIPLAVYAFESFIWVMFSKTVYTEFGLVSIIMWLLIAAGLLYAIATSVEDGLLMCALLFGGFFLWFIPFYVAISENNGSSAFKYIFRLTYIVTAVALIALIYTNISNKKNASQNAANALTVKGLAVDIGALAAGVIPLFIAKSMSEANPYAVFFVILAIYGALGFLFVLLTKFIKNGNKKLTPSPGMIILSFVISGVQYFYINSVKEALLPYGFLEDVMDLMESDFFYKLKDGAEVISDAVNEAVSDLLYMIISLVCRIFDAHINRFDMPELIGYVVSIVVIVLMVGLGTFVGSLEGKKTTGTEKQRS